MERPPVLWPERSIAKRCARAESRKSAAESSAPGAAEKIFDDAEVKRGRGPLSLRGTDRFGSPDTKLQ
jgi:hypothetical protein